MPSSPSSNVLGTLSVIEEAEHHAIDAIIPVFDTDCNHFATLVTDIGRISTFLSHELIEEHCHPALTVCLGFPRQRLNDLVKRPLQVIIIFVAKHKVPSFLIRECVHSSNFYYIPFNEYCQLVLYYSRYIVTGYKDGKTKQYGKSQ